MYKKDFVLRGNKGINIKRKYIFKGLVTMAVFFMKYQRIILIVYTVYMIEYRYCYKEC